VGIKISTSIKLKGIKRPRATVDWLYIVNVLHCFIDSSPEVYRAMCLAYKLHNFDNDCFGRLTETGKKLEVQTLVKDMLLSVKDWTVFAQLERLAQIFLVDNYDLCTYDYGQDFLRIMNSIWMRDHSKPKLD
jgi:hypothetical protein